MAHDFEPSARPYPRESRGTPATRADAIAYNHRWTDYDRQIVSAELDRLRDQTAYLWRTESNSYIRATDKYGKALMYIEAGYLWWHEGRVETLPEGVLPDDEGWILPLSTRQDSGSRQGPREETEAAICQRCFSYALSRTGLCPSCDE